MSFVLRLATGDEVTRLQTLIAASVRTLSAGYYTPQQIESALIHVFGVDTQLIADGTYYAMETEEDATLVACGGWSRRATLYGSDRAKAGRPDALLDPARDPARVRAFFVHPDWARHGLGQRLLARCEDAAREAGFHRITLAATLPGEPFYLRYGYEPLERVDVPMADGVTLPIVNMTKSL